MAQHAPDVVSAAKRTLASGVIVSLVLDDGQPQGAAYPAVWWRLERYLPQAEAKVAALEAMLPPPSDDTNVKSCTRAESAWYHAIDLSLAISAARAGTLDQFWVGKPSATWWAGLPTEVKAGFVVLMVACRP